MSENAKEVQKAGEKPSMNAKEVQKAAAVKGRKVHLNDRMTLEVIADSGYYKKGQIIHPHKVYGEELIKNKVAKEQQKTDN